MIPVRRILCPTDFSDFSKRALEEATLLARRFGGVLHVQHIANGRSADSATRPHHPSAIPATAAPSPLAEEALREELRRFVEPAERAGVALEIELTWGHPVSAILERARSLCPDLLVIGTHGRSGFEHSVLGSVAEKVVRKAPCPVLTLRADSPVSARPSHILCPVDESDSTRRTLRWALTMGNHANACVEVVHVFEVLPELPAVALFWASDQLQVMKRHSRRRLQAMLTEIRKAEGVSPKAGLGVTVLSGKAHREIVAAAQARRSDLIVIGVHGRGVADRVLFGSTAHHVVREATCPVLSVRKPAHCGAALAQAVGA